MRSGTTSWITGCSCDPGRPAPPIYEVSGAGLPYRRFESLAFICAASHGQEAKLRLRQ